MRIAFAHHEPIDAGKARWVAMVRTLAAVAELEPVTFFTPDSPETVIRYATQHLGLSLPTGLVIHTLPSVRKLAGLTLNGVFFRACRKALADARPDLIWLRSDKLAAHLAHRGKHAPVVYEAHLVGSLWAADRGDSPRRAARLHELEAAIYGDCAGVAAISHGLLDEIRMRFRYTGPGSVAPSAVDTSLFRPMWDGGDGRTVAYVGTLQFWKGLETLLRAIALAPALRLLLVGSGKPDEESALRASLLQLGIADRVTLAGRMPQPRIAQAVHHAACAVHPLPPGHSISARFTSPLKVFEYMALGLPVVASDVPSAREVLRDGHNARLYAAGDEAALAAALVELCSNRELASSLSRNALSEIAQHSYQARARTLQALFRQCVPQAKP